MAKYDFNTSAYVKLWDSIEGRQMIEYVLGNPDMVRQNNDLWRAFFTVDNYTFPVAPDGTASFTMTVRQPKPSGMAHMRAPLGDTITTGEGEKEKYSGTIPDFISTGTVEKAMERQYKEDLYAQLGSDVRILVDWATNVVQVQQDELNATLTNMAMQVMTKGSIVYNYGKGITDAPLLKMPMQENRFLKAGEKAWTAADCKLLTQMRAIEKNVKENILADEKIPLEWKVDYDMYWNVVMKNAEVLEYVKDRIYMEKGVKIDNPALQTNGDYSRYLSGVEGLSPIRVVSEHQFDGGVRVNGWAAGKAVLSPAGYQGKIVRKEILDRKILDKYSNPAISRAWGTTPDGLMLLQNSTLPNGLLKEWQTMMMMSALPVLDEWPYHFIVNTQQAGA